jgi:DNA polymerase III delta prime subunit
MSLNWIEKYEPKSSKDFIGNSVAVSKIRKWLADFPNSSPSYIIIGSIGVGKTILSKLLLKEAGYDYIYYASSDEKKDDIYETVINNPKKKIGVIIDDTNRINLTNEKKNIINLFLLNEIKKKFPIILISNLTHSKFINKLVQKKYCPEIKFELPGETSLKTIINKICLGEDLTINGEVINKIIEYSQKDIRKCILILEDLYLTFGNSIDDSKFRVYRTYTQRKDIDCGLLISNKNLMDNYKSIQASLKMYDKEKVLLPLMLFENYPLAVDNKMLAPKDKIDMISNVTNSLSIGDVIETNIYSDQNWYLQDTHGFFSCVKPSFDMISKNNSKFYNLNFSYDLNSVSIKNINRKNFVNIRNHLINFNNNDILYLHKIYKYQIKNKKTDKLNKLLTTYKITIKNITSINNIDKTYRESE